MYPDPKEIQNNLSGFLSFKNARIFTGELWQQLINSMESSNTVKKEIPKYNNDKIKSFPRLGPTENKQISTIVSQNKSSDRKENRHYRLTGSRSDSFSSSFSRSRSRSIDTYKYRDNEISRSETRSRTKSSSSYTPYRRYSNYTDSYEERLYSYRSSSHHNYKARSYSSSSISIYKPDVHKKPDSVKLNGLCFSIDSESIISSPNKEFPTTYKELEEVITKKSFSDYSHLSEFQINNFKKVSSSPKGLSSVYNSQSSSSSSSTSIAFFSPGNLHLYEMSPATDTSSSDYTIEFMDKHELNHSDQYTSDKESESGIEWITIEELQELKNNEYDVSCYSSPTNSYSTSEYSLNDIEWIEENQLDQLSNKYFLM